MTSRDKRAEPDFAFLHAAYLQAVVNLYEPWTELESLSSAERKLARARVAQARRELVHLKNPRPRQAHH